EDDDGDGDDRREGVFDARGDGAHQRPWVLRYASRAATAMSYMSAGTMLPRSDGVSCPTCWRNAARAAGSRVVTVSLAFCMAATASASTFGTSVRTRCCMARAACVTAARSASDSRFQAAVVTTVAPTSGATRRSSM